MDLFDHLRCRLELIKGSRWSSALLRDSLRLGRDAYVAKSRSGSALKLEPGRGEWFTFYENLIRGDYFHNLARLEEGSCVVDIGANIGAFTVDAARRVGPAGCVHAFEPDPEVCERLSDNVKLNGLTNVVIHNCAVGGENGEACLYRHGKSAFTSLLATVDDRSQQHSESFTVRVMGAREALQACGGRIDLLKVDCEGAEYDLFDALDADAVAAVKQISMEVHAVPNRTPASLEQRLEVLGYQVTPGYPLVATRTADPVQAALKTAVA